MKKIESRTFIFKIVLLAFFLVAATSGVTNFVSTLLAPTPQGKVLYKINGTSYQSGDILTELLLTLKYNNIWDKSERNRLLTGKALKGAYLESRIAGDLLFVHAQKQRLLKDEEFKIYLRMAIREAVKQYLFQKLIKQSAVSGNEIEKFYNKYRNKLARFPYDKARTLIIKNIRLQKRKKAVVALIETLKKKYKLEVKSRTY